MAASRRDLATTDEPDLTFTVKPRPPVRNAWAAADTMSKAGISVVRATGRYQPRRRTQSASRPSQRLMRGPSSR